MPNPPEATTALHARIVSRIREAGPISVAEYMTLCLLDPVDGYYPTRDPLGVDGDFVTAPEISQMFGEALGLFALQCWQDMGRPEAWTLVEMGPGRGVMMSDMLRSLRLEPDALSSVRVVLVEVSAALQAVQARTLGPSGASVSWANGLEDVEDLPTLVVGNEYLDCLPIRQFVGQNGAWCERRVGADGGALRFETDGRPAPAAATDGLPAPVDGALVEVCPAVAQTVDHLAERFARTPGRALFIDYGPEETGFGDTLQAVKAHEKVGVFDAPGDTDLTARVDFGRLSALAQGAGLDVPSPLTQAALLRCLGMEQRAVGLIRANPDAKPKIMRQLHRLLGEDEMGTLFKAALMSSPGLPEPLCFS